MSEQASVLYDIPGPKAKRFNLIMSVIFAALLLLLAACAQRDANRGCTIHASLGWQPMQVCATYPIIGIRTPDGVDITAVHRCLSVCRNESSSA